MERCKAGLSYSPILGQIGVLIKVLQGKEEDSQQQHGEAATKVPGINGVHQGTQAGLISPVALSAVWVGIWCDRQYSFLYLKDLDRSGRDHYGMALKVRVRSSICVVQ